MIGSNNNKFFITITFAEDLLSRLLGLLDNILDVDEDLLETFSCGELLGIVCSIIWLESKVLTKYIFYCYLYLLVIIKFTLHK